MIYTDLKIKQEAPDFSFIIVENKAKDADLNIIRWDSKSQRLKSVGTVQTILGMNELMSRSLEILTGPSESPTNLCDATNSGIYFAPDFPEFLLPVTDVSYKAAPQVRPACITWGTVRKEPGTLSGEPFRGTQELKPRHREYLAVLGDEAKRWVVSSNDSNLEALGGLVKFIKIRAQVFDNLVQYNIWTKSNYEAEVLTEWFERYMDDYRGMFREAGIVELIFNRRVRDDTLVQMNNGYHVRSVLYYVRTERTSVVSISPIRRINLDVSVSNLVTTVNDMNDQLIEHDLYQRIINKWIKNNK